MLKRDSEHETVNSLPDRQQSDGSSCSKQTDSEEDCETLREIYNAWKDQSKRVSSWQFDNS